MYCIDGWIKNFAKLIQYIGMMFPFHSQGRHHNRQRGGIRRGKSSPTEISEEKITTPVKKGINIIHLQ